MTAVDISAFRGVLPGIEAHLLERGYAQTANNVKLSSGGLVSWRRPTRIVKPAITGTPKTIYRMYSGATDYWLAWPDVVHAVKGPIAGDTSFKLYFTGDSRASGHPKKTNLTLATSGGSDYPNDYLEMGVPALPLAGIACNVVGGAAADVTRSYVFTLVTAWSEEGPPSAVFTHTGKPDGSWNFTGLPAAGPAGDYDWTGGKLRIYRANTGASGITVYQRVVEISIGTTTYNDTVADASLGVVCPTFINGVVNSEWVAPPNDMEGLVALSNGSFAGFSGNLLCFSEPYFPHAWPVRYRLAMNFEIVGLCAIGSSVVVATEGWPVIVTGNAPGAMSVAYIEEDRPCTSIRGIVKTPAGAGFPTPDGYVVISPSGTANISEWAFRDGATWKSRSFPDTLIAAWYQDKLFGFFQDDSGGMNFVLDGRNDRRNLAFGDFDVSGVYRDPETADLYIIQNAEIYQWDADTINNSAFDWKSGRITLPKPVNLGAFDIEADFAALADSDAVAAQQALDTSFNATLFALDPLAGVTARANTTPYVGGDVRKSADGTYLLICTVGGTSGGSAPTYPSTMTTFVDGGVTWMLSWDVQDLILACLGSHVLGGYVPYDAADPILDTQGVNGKGIMLGGSLLVGGEFANYDTRSLLVKIHAGGQLRKTKYVTHRGPHALPSGYKADDVEVEISGNVDVTRIRLAETASGLRRV